MSRGRGESEDGMPTVSTTRPSCSCRRNLRVPSAAVTSLNARLRPVVTLAAVKSARKVLGSCRASPGIDIRCLAQSGPWQAHAFT